VSHGNGCQELHGGRVRSYVLPTMEGTGVGVPVRGLADVRRFSHEAMATVYEIYVQHADAQYAAQAAREAFDLIDRLERELSRFIANSDISRVNRLSAGEGIRVSASTIECLLIARHVFDLTGGAFDASIGTGLASLELDADESLVRATREGVQVDLGAIGKGYAVDLVGELLEEWGLAASLVHGGFSSMVAIQPPAEAPGWPLTFSDPTDPSRVLARLSLCQTALGASGVQKGAHIVDPRTGAPAAGRLAAWAAVPRPQAASGATSSPGSGPRLAPAAVADALTTAFMLLSLDDVGALCASSPGLEAWILESGGGELVHFGLSGLEP
jgi:thiamine biosynthesis lipoprotein